MIIELSEIRILIYVYDVFCKHLLSKCGGVNIYWVLEISPRELMREGLAQAIRRCACFRTGAAVPDAGTALELPGQFVPDLIVIDGGTDIEAATAGIRQLRRRWPGVRVVVLVPDHTWPAVIAPNLPDVSAVVPEATSIEELVSTLLRAVSRAGASAGRGKRPDPLRTVDSTPTYGALTMREQEVLTLLAEGSTNKQIAGRLGLSELTVKSHLKEIYSKLQVQNRVEAALVWRENQPVQ